MLFHVRMDVRIPLDLDPGIAADLKAKEKARFQDLQLAGQWRHIWRVVGEYANVSIFDVADNTELHDLLLSLPLFPYMQIAVTPLCRHPSSVHHDDR
ncbi:muconolactone delta-isomerase [Pseudoxanthomonas sp. GM95]|uniref:muconolactone Delta-isomerase n=1 Tax=Pseudoxanthomonas sp. GM95 TaxID=1881043 RepID=UPI0008D00CF9|nr:muconolactone Delta-isomerase [Pseudoxanthomonas sp. GM95]SEM53280.1 muconolactone delta-isomerase [Pseudoxanthomonas sp. GM95]